MINLITHVKRYRTIFLKKEVTAVAVCNILTTNLAACVSVCVSVHNLTNFCPDALISTPNVPTILFA